MSVPTVLLLALLSSPTASATETSDSHTAASVVTILDTANVEVATFDLSSIPASESVSTIEVWIDFGKYGDAYVCNAANTSRPYFQDIEFKLETPAGIRHTLVRDSWFARGGNGQGRRVQMTFDDASATGLPNIPVTGTSRPHQPFIDRRFESATGTWKLLASDDFPAHPLCYYASSITLTSFEDVTIDPGGPFEVVQGEVFDPATSLDAGFTAEWDCDDDGVADATGTSDSACYWESTGTYSVELYAYSATEHGSATVDVEVLNLPPVFESFDLESPAVEGQATTMTIQGQDPFDTDLDYVWRFPDGSGAQGATASYAFPDNGFFDVVVTILDSAGGEFVHTETVEVLNADPAVALTGPATVPEGAPFTPVFTATDVPADALSYAWDFGDGTTSTDPAPTHAYANNGTYTITLVVTDDDGGVSSDDFLVTALNVAPTVVGDDLPTVSAEGVPVTFEGVANDPGMDTITFAWDFGDGTTATGDSVSHAFPDNGTYTVTVTATDSDLGVGILTYTMTTANVAPVFAGTAATSATEGIEYVYEPSVQDVPGDTLSFTLIGAPAGMSVEPTTGRVTWTPTYAQAQLGAESFRLRVLDKDGAFAERSTVLSVGYLDTDADGVPDTWEDLNGFDSTNGSDGTADLDADGRGNALEFELGTDPLVYGGPSVPEPSAPIGGEEVTATEPVLAWLNATSGFNDPLSYAVEIYDDVARTNLLATFTDIAELTDVSEVVANSTLSENFDLGWRVRAEDAFVVGEWSETESFFYNAVEEPPAVPEPLFPVDEVIAAGARFQANVAVDPDRDELVYDMEIATEDEVVIDSATDLTPDLSLVNWLTQVEFEEDRGFLWRALARDEHGLESGWSDWAWFLYSTVDGAPNATMWEGPLAEERVESLTPTILLAAVADPERQDISWTIELSKTPDFAVIEHTISGTTESAEDGVESFESPELEEHVAWYGRAQAADPQGTATAFVDGSFFTAGPNDPPSVPAWNAASENPMARTFAASSDPESDPFVYEYEATDSTGTLIAEGELSADDERIVELPDGAEDSLYTLRVRATDALGAPSDWAETTSEVGQAGCGCQSSGQSGTWALVALVGLLARRREQ